MKMLRWKGVMALPSFKANRVTIHKDKGGNHWTIPHETTQRTGSTAQVDVWWPRGGPKKIQGRKGRTITVRPETLVVRQVNVDDTADVLMLTPGQVYDLIAALSMASEMI